MTTAVDARSPADGAAPGRGQAPIGRQGPRRRLFAKYAAALVGLVSLVLLINGSLNVWFSYNEAKDAAIRLQREKAAAAAQRIEEFVSEIERQIGWTTATQWASAPIEQRRFDYGRLLRQVPAITELIQLDKEGREQLKVSRLAMDVVGSGEDRSGNPAFAGAQDKKVWFGPVYFRKESEPYMTMAVAHSGRNAGVTVAEVNLKLIWDVINAIKIGKTGYAYVIDDKGRLIAHPDISRVLRNSDLSALPQVTAARDTTAPADGPPPIVRNFDGHRVLSASAAIPKLGWLLFVEQPLSEALAPLYTALLNTGLLLVLGLAVAVLAGLLLARRMTGPIRALDAGAARIGAGALDHRIAVHTGDELEELAQRFNTMAADLQSSYADLEKKVEDRTAELTEALDQQTATTEVLGVINSSPGDLAPVFDAILEKAHRLCGAAFGSLNIYDGEELRAVAVRGLAESFADRLRQGFRPGAEHPTRELLSGARTVQIPDAAKAAEPIIRASCELAGIRTVLFVPLRKDDRLLGLIVAGRQEVLPFSEKETALLENFAAQAVIAMENARLLTETREALDQQTATAEVLGVINSSPGDLVPVFEAMLEKAMRLCSAAFGYLMTYDGERFQEVAHRGLPPRFAEYLPRLDQPGPSGAYASIKAGAPLVHIADLKEGDVYLTSPLRQALVDLGGARTSIIVALRKDEALLGVLTIYRQEIRPFSEKQIALLENFAAQAVIAMENARLITETREALEQQTATAEVLGVINSSPGDLAPVFDAILEKAHALCGVSFGSLLLYDGGQFHAGATRGLPEPLTDLLRQPFPPDPDGPLAHLLAGERFYQTGDQAEFLTTSRNRRARATFDLAGVRTVLFVPLRRDEALLGAIVAYRREPQAFSEKQIALLQNFAAQAVIAMENARLITETREALEQQTATAEVLEVINSSPGDLEPVFDAMLERATRLSEGVTGVLWTIDGERVKVAATHGFAAEFIDLLREHERPEVGPAWPLRQIISGERVVHIANVGEHDLYHTGDPLTKAGVEHEHIGTFVLVALVKDGVAVGAFSIGRRAVRPFSGKQIALLENFAAQAVIAMENARLITETREALEQQTATAEILQVINSSPGDLAPVFDAMLDKALGLCGAAFGVLWTYDGERVHAAALRGVPLAFAEFLTRAPHSVGPDNAHGRLLRGEPVVHIADVAEDEAYESGDLIRRTLIELGGGRTLLGVPLRKDDVFLGDFVIYRQEVRPFTDKQIALLQNFAAQAVIAMENARLITETREALEQQTATAEVLQVINSSPGDLAPVFDAMLDKAHSLCGVTYGSLELFDGEHFRAVAVHGFSDTFADLLKQGYRAFDSPVSRQLIESGRFAHVPDLAQIDHPITRLAVELEGIRTLLCVPLCREGALLGMIVSGRREVRPFSDKQIALLQNFAAQAVIAMENARLITETREALEQQTATAEVLGVINSSPGDLTPVFDAMLDKAIRLCEATHGHLFTYDGERFHLSVVRGEPRYIEWAPQAGPVKPYPNAPLGRIERGERIIHVADIREEEVYRVVPIFRESADLRGTRSQITVALIKDNVLLGAMVVYRQEVKPFSDKQIALLQSFAAQAVIAMENARLLGELRGRTRDLQESLEYQTATSDVLKVISQSGGELDPVLQTLVETAARICEADKAVLQQLRGGSYRMAASFGFTEQFKDYRARNPITPDRGTPIGRMTLDRGVVHIEDALSDPEFTDFESQRLGQFRTMLGVPLFREDAIVGGLFLARSRVEPFTEKQIALVTTFADQAVIAIENARLFNELRTRTAELGRSVDELKMLSEVGQAVSSTLDLRAVLSTILTRSVGLAGAEAGVIFRYSRGERAFRFVEAVGATEATMRAIRELVIPENMTGMGEAIAHRAPVQIPDLRERAPNPLRDLALADGYRSVLIVPLVGADRIMGATILQRRATGEFPPETVRLMQTLASQSVLAIQNARLFREIADKSEQLALASQHKSQFLANMSHELRTPLNAILGYAELLVDGIYGVLPDRPKGVLERIQNNGRHLLALINDVLDLAKIEAGQLTLTLEDYSLPEVVKSVVTATEPLAAAKRLKFTAEVQDAMPMAHGDARRVSQVLLNLVGNAIKFTDAGEVEIRASSARGQFTLTVRDTGPGIADADQERIFGEFQQIDNSNTRQKGGTGLGLAISKRMVEMQGGTIAVESALGQGSTFRVVLPVHVDEMMEAAE